MNVSSLQLFHDGSNSLLYFHEDPATRTPCVVKVMKEGVGDDSLTAAFYNEYEIAKSLEIEGVPRYFRKEHLDGRPAIVLSYFEGKPLGALFSGQPVDLGLFLDIARQASSILAKVHQNKIIHKDINANNILYNPETEQVQVIDFGISSNFDLRTQQLGNPENLEGTLAYISPEQTGRMNRVVDFRTDLYSLGVTFYELLTGRLPFEKDDSMELVHCHLARRPLPPCELDGQIPEALSNIVMRLMEKSASDRYQSALGLEADLRKCQEQLEEKGVIEPFEIGAEDYSEKLQLSEKLYGCEEEEQKLIDAFERVGEGAVELLLVKGYAGVGKSSLVAEVHRPITERKGYFIKGKHDQYQRATPYAALLQAFSDWVEQVLTESMDSISEWKKILKEGLGEGINVLLDVVPQLELIIGERGHAERLSPAEAANRFNFVFRRFIQVISRKDHPLVIFLDDLQWADAATLQSLKLLMTDKENGYLLIIGAYRDNEVEEAHPLVFTLADLEQSQASMSFIEVSNLSEQHVGAFLVDSLQASPERVAPLAELMHQKTQGNAFFVNQFISSLYQEGFLSFNAANHQWEWDLEGIKKQNITNNVVELMAGKIGKLPDQTKYIVQLAACIGDHFSLEALSNVYGEGIVPTFHAIWKAVEEGLVIPLDNNYKLIAALDESSEVSVNCNFQFLHDRVQQAAYQLLSEEQKVKVHHQIGTRFLLHASEEDKKEQLFELVTHVNMGAPLMTSKEERLQLSQLNRMAAQKAKDSTAYEAAHSYLENALNHLGAEGWSISYEESLLTHIEMAETAYLLGKREEMEEFVSKVLDNAEDPLDKVKAYEVRGQAYIAMGEMKTAVSNALKVLTLLDVTFPKRPNKIHVLQGLAKIQWIMRNRASESILDAPKMEDLRVRAAVRILSSTAIAAFFANKTLYALFAIKQVLLSLKYGNAYTTPSAYGSVALIYTAVLKRYEQGYKFGDFSLRLMKKRNAKKLQARIAMIFHSVVSPWVRHVAIGLEPLKEGFQQGLDSGDFEYGLHSALEHILCGIYTGREIGPLLETNIRFYAVAKQVDQRDPREVLQVMCQVLENYSNADAPDPIMLNGSYCNEEEEYAQWVEGNSRSTLACANVLKLYTSALFERWESVDSLSKKIHSYLDSVAGTVAAPFANFSESICWLGLAFETKDEQEKKRCIRQIKKNQNQMKGWMRHAPMNLEHRYYLIEAELAALAVKEGKASRLYKKAIHLAQENDYPNDEALALERFANFCLRQGNLPVAGLYFRKAYIGYQKWGLKSKLVQLQEKHYELLLPEEIPNLTSTQVEVIEPSGRPSTVQNSMSSATKRLKNSTMNSSSSGGGVNMLDFSSLFKASNALAQEVNMQHLQEKMLEITLENAGAQLGIFIQNSEEKGLYIAAAHAQEEEAGREKNVQTGIDIANSKDIPRSMVNYVARTKKPLVLAHAVKDQTYAFDSYIKENECLSVMCFPVVSQGKLGGIIYLENNLITNAFTEDRLEVLNTLSTQMSIALENATLYNNLEAKVRERTEALNDKNQELEEQHKKITDSIRYAQTIQVAMLPSAKDFIETFKEHFILFRPKDIVSGDFYWMRRKGNSIYIAVSDCTGHGVPGAFMSTVGVSLLDEILIEKGIRSPGMILELLNLGIRTGLRQDETDNDDGMDVCLCAITPQGDGTFEISYAGAKRPLYYISNGELAQLKGTNKAIGGFLNRKNKEFQTYSKTMEDGDMLYLSSDGYVDQSNVRQKKIGSRFLCELLQKNHQLPLEKQKQIMEKILDVHQEGTEQRDDITIIGIRL